MDGGVVRGVMVEQERSVREVTADYYVSALPIEVMATIVTDQMVRADPSLANIFPLSHNAVDERHPVLPTTTTRPSDAATRSTLMPHGRLRPCPRRSSGPMST